MKRIYISGPMTGCPNHNTPAFQQAARVILDAGHVPVSPVGEHEGWEWADYMRRDLRLLLDSDAIHMLPGWQNSTGALIEHHFAQQLRMEIMP